MTFRIGPIFFECGPIGDTMSTFGDQIVFSIEYTAVSTVDLDRVRSQALGMSSSPQAQPITSSDDPGRWDGMYNVTVAEAPVGNHFASLTTTLNVSATPVDERIETAYTLTRRSAITDYTIAATHGHYSGESLRMATADSEGFALDGTVSVADRDNVPALLSVGSKAAADLTEVEVGTSVVPEWIDIGATKLETVNEDGADWWEMTGGKVPTGNDVRLSNGLVRITPQAESAYLHLEAWNGSVWVPAARFEMDLYEFARPVRVNYMTRAATSVRLFPTPTSLTSRVLDLTIRRGVSGVSLSFVSSFGALTFTPSIVMTEADGSAMATTTYTAGAAAGLRRTSTIDGVYPRLHLDSGAASSASDSVTAGSASNAHRFGILVAGDNTAATEIHDTNVAITDMIR